MECLSHAQNCVLSDVFKNRYKYMGMVGKIAYRGNESVYFCSLYRKYTNI